MTKFKVRENIYINLLRDIYNTKEDGVLLKDVVCWYGGVYSTYIELMHKAGIVDRVKFGRASKLFINEDFKHSIYFKTFLNSRVKVSSASRAWDAFFSDIFRCNSEINIIILLIGEGYAHKSIINNSYGYPPMNKLINNHIALETTHDNKKSIELVDDFKLTALYSACESIYNYRESL